MTKTNASGGKPAVVHSGKTVAKASSGKRSADHRILVAIKEAAILRNTNAPSRDLIAQLAGYSDPSCSTIRKALQKLKSKGYVIYDSKSASLTEEGNEAAGTLSIDMTNESIQESYKAKLDGPKPRKAFEVLQNGGTVDREALAVYVGCDAKSSTFRKVLAPLRKFNLLEEVDGKSRLRLSNIAFPFGRPKSCAVTTI